MEVLSKVQIDGEFKALNELFDKLVITDDRDVNRLTLALLKVMSHAFDLKRVIMREKEQWIKSMIAEDFIKSLSPLVHKGLAHEERKLYVLLASPDRVKELKVNEEFVEFVLESLHRYESILKTIIYTLRLESKLSFEGHQ